MTTDAFKVVTIQLLERSFQLKCPIEKSQPLLEAAQYLNSKMIELQKGGNTLGYERTLVMAAMDVCFELVNLREQSQSKAGEIHVRLQALSDNIDATIANHNIRLPQSPTGEQQSLEL